MPEPLSPIGAAILPVTPLQQNCTIVWCTKTMKGAVIDPGGEVDRLLQAAAQKGVTLEKIWITHGHLDHAGGAHDLQQRTGLPIEGPHPDDEFWIDGISAQGMMYGMPEAKSFATGRWLADGDRVQLGETEFEVYHCPGHTPGHVIFFHREARFAQVGDVLFQGSVGRWDFPRGNQQDLIRSITTKLWPLGDDVRFVPGHGPMSSFGEERRSNPYVSDRVRRRGRDPQARIVQLSVAPTSLLVWPLLAQVGWTFFLYAWLTVARLAAVRSGETEFAAFVLGRDEPLPIARITRNLSNQFELPVIFYAICVLVVATRQVSWLDIAAAWAFVAGRLIHSAIQTLTDDVPLRGRLFMINFLALAVLVAHVAWLAGRSAFG